ncbi:MAG: hypothetical protein H0T04_04165 [Chloroflexi bacterium]|nr:hypothetical protein [Chloroflexota bacterium]
MGASQFVGADAAAQVQDAGQLRPTERGTRVIPHGAAPDDRLLGGKPAFERWDGKPHERPTGVLLVERRLLAPVRDAAQDIDDAGLAPLVVDDADVGPLRDLRRGPKAATQCPAAHGSGTQTQETTP